MVLKSHKSNRLSMLIIQFRKTKKSSLTLILIKRMMMISSELIRLTSSLWIINRICFKISKGSSNSEILKTRIARNSRTLLISMILDFHSHKTRTRTVSAINRSRVTLEISISVILGTTNKTKLNSRTTILGTSIVFRLTSSRKRARKKI